MDHQASDSVCNHFCSPNHLICSHITASVFRVDEGDNIWKYTTQISRLLHTRTFKQNKEEVF